MEKKNVRIQKLNEKAIVPSYGSPCAAGADLYAFTEGETITINPHETKFIHTGIAMEIPDGLVGLIYARSGIACKRSLAPANKVGVIDSDYRGEIMVALHNHSEEIQQIEDGERIAQIVLNHVHRMKFEPSEELTATERGINGFGSTGI